MVSALGDDAVVLGAVALAMMQIGENPLKENSTAISDLAELAIDLFRA